MGITAKDIAEKLGVSPSAVSLALNGKPGVSVATRERILAEAIRMGYITQKSSAEAVPNIRYVIFLERGDAVRETSFYSIVLQGIEARAKEYGYNVLISYFDTSKDWNEQINVICKDISGLIVLGTEIKDRHIAMAQAHGVGRLDLPLVMVDNATSLVDLDCVVADNRCGAYRAASYLLNKGYPDVGYLRSTVRIDSFDEREAGIIKARREWGLLKKSPTQCVDVGISSEQAFYDMSTWLDQGGKPLPALFADNDIIAASCIRALKSHGYQVPRDVSVVGFDDMPICTMVDPPLTTVHIAKELMGMLAMEILHQRIRDGGRALCDERTDMLRTTISTHLVERESVAPFCH